MVRGDACWALDWPYYLNIKKATTAACIGSRLDSFYPSAGLPLIHSSLVLSPLTPWAFRNKSCRLQLIDLPLLGHQPYPANTSGNLKQDALNRIDDNIFAYPFLRNTALPFTWH